MLQLHKPPAGFGLMAASAPHNSGFFLVVSVPINNVCFQDCDFPLLIQTSAVHFTGARLDPEAGEG